MCKPRLRKPRFRRCENSIPLSITERDVLILSLVERYRLMASNHLLRLIGGSRQHLIRRLGRLFHAGYLERPRAQLFLCDRPSRGIACVLAGAGRKALQVRGLPGSSTAYRCRAVTSSLSLAHSLRVADVVSHFESSTLQRGWRFVPHQDWFGKDVGRPRLSQVRWKIRLKDRGRRIDKWLIPDAAFAIETGSDRPCFFLVEYDRGTMPVRRSSFTQSSFYRKVLAYIETRRCGALWKHFEVPSFRVLVITESTKRMHNLQAATAACFQRGESKMFLFMSLEDAKDLRLLDGNWHQCSGLKVRLFD